MKRDIDKIQAFNRSAGLDRVKNLQFYDASVVHFKALERELNKTGAGFWRPYFYVAIVTTLESQLKYYCKILIDIAGYDRSIFKRFFQDNKVDIEPLFTILDGGTSLGDFSCRHNIIE